MSGRPDISQYGRTVYSVIYVAVNRCAIIIQIMCYAVKGVKISHYIQNFKRQNSINAEKISLSVRTFDEEKSTVQKSVPSWHKLFIEKFCPSWTEFSKPTSRQLVGNKKTDFRSTWSKVRNPTSAQVGQKLKITSKQLAPKWVMPLRHKLCRS